MLHPIVCLSVIPIKHGKMDNYGSNLGGVANTFPKNGFLILY